MQKWEFCVLKTKLDMKTFGTSPQWIEVHIQTPNGLKEVLKSETYQVKEYKFPVDKEAYDKMRSKILAGLGVDGWIPCPRLDRWESEFWFKRPIEE